MEACFKACWSKGAEIECDPHKSNAVQLPKLPAGLRENPAIEQTDDEFYLYMKVPCSS